MAQPAPRLRPVLSSLAPNDRVSDAVGEDLGAGTEG
jgi:hypothetical protein